MTKFVPDSYYPIDIATCPETWELAVVGEVTADIQPGFASGKHNQLGLGIPHLRPMNIDRLGQIDLTVVKYVSREDGPRLRLDDVLFNNTNSPQLIGKTAWIGQDAGWAFSNHMTRIRMPEGLAPKFVAYQLHYLWMTGYFLHRCVKHVNQASISSTALGQTVALVLPPLPEQHRIVVETEKQCTRLDAAETALKRVQANLKRYRASVLKAACEGKLVPTEAELAQAEGRAYEPADQLLKRILTERRARWASQTKRRGKYKEPVPPDTSDLPELPAGWVWAALSTVGEVRLGRQRSPKRAIGPNMRPYLRAANVTWGGLDLSDVKEMDFNPTEFETYRLIPGDIVLNEASGSPDEVGKPAVWGGQIDGCCFQNTLIRVRAFPGIVPYLHYHLQSDARSGNLGRAARGVGIHHLGAEGTASWMIALPPLEEQRRIVAEIERRLSVIRQAESTVEASLRRVGRLRQSILKQAFSGQLVPQDPSDEPASALLERIRAERAATQAVASTRRQPRRRRRAQSAPDSQRPLLESDP